MSVNMQPASSIDSSHEDITAFARGVVVDQRITKAVQGFDVPFFQAGLAGYSDGAMRLIARRHGCPFCVTEALLDVTLINGGKGRIREDPDFLAAECGCGDLEENKVANLDDHPIAGQVMGTTPDEMAQGAAILVGMGYDVIDVNLACPVKKIRKRKRGGHFLTSAEEACDVLAAVRKVVPPNIPTTVKLRRGWDDSDESTRNFFTIFDAAYTLGYSWVTVHARSVEQKYLGSARWLFLKDLVAARPDALVFGSGDIWCAADIFRMMEQTGVHGVSVARGCIGNPWIFQQARELMAGKEPKPPTTKQQRSALLEHFALSTSLHGEKTASRMMRKFGIKFSQHHDNSEEVRIRFIQVKSMDEWNAVLDEYY
ncbi:MAG TPA: tRNA-dihydrouridine synthase family protein [Phycisphaerales bacterium]|nr:tRNA-dihydrouridine synthase family protein [Phycisphaerales bacterium]